MLEQVLRYINNRFERDAVTGEFRASGGSIEVPGALDGQYVWVEGSALNDGLHAYPSTDMADEEFSGTVYLLAVPGDLADLAAEIAAWCEANRAALDSPYQSESFGGYSYSKGGGSSSDGGSGAGGWQGHFATRLRPYRKLYRDWE